ncbi:Oidioi.mRNA.OKI2018_I69.XSR.g16432.t1.cds [Oikopleura dioica]|uniref:Oidioi.mRNA.OKI2018_I69.XSR.g16432.t1.cds n=1 Tax=Oikopleura dioica TaxID=34765 RepID=A0ABN7SK26_OIKDI|nr:Oidioi.mRNA.OKI2018_I69.XSR.g16432.t1.cds [Oikopleura dioica]
MALQFESYDGGNFMGNLYMNMLVGTAAEALEAGDFNEVDRNIERRIGNAFFKAQRYQYAIKKYEDAIKHFDGTDIAVYNNIAMCYYKLGQTEDASNNFDKCRTKCIKALVIGQQHGAQKKDISKAMARIGMCYECEKDYEKAIEWFEKSVAEHPDKHVSINLAKLKKQHQK